MFGKNLYSEKINNIITKTRNLKKYEKEIAGFVFHHFRDFVIKDLF